MELGITLKNLLALSKIDALLAGIVAKKRELEGKLKEKKEELNKAIIDHGKKMSEYESKNENYNKEERRLKEQQQKLIDRRKALTTLGSYKLQMSAEREIDAASRQLTAQEEVLLKNLDTIDELKKVADAAKEALDQVQKDFENFTNECRAALGTMKTRVAEYSSEKAKLLPLIDARTLDTYKLLAQRHIDPVVPLKNNSCGGCFLELGPQAIVELAGSNTIVRCRSCGRILYLEDNGEL